MLLLAAALAGAPQATALKPPAVSSSCRRPTSYIAGAESRYDGKPLQPRKLTELPPGNMYVAVFRHDANGCEAPIVVKYNIGR